jgi:hypothetical protein
MPRVLSSPSAGSTIVSTLNITEGGTGATTASMALNNLGAIPANKLDAPNGVASLDSTGKLKPSVLPVNEVSTIAISGPSSLVVGQPGTFTITNFDVFTNYQVIANSGSVSRTGDTIVYTAPAASGISGFTINGKTVNVTVMAIQPNQPTITSPSDGSQNRNSSMTVTCSAFSMNFGSDTHLSSDWELSTDAGFNNVVALTTDNDVQKTDWFIGGLDANKTYYVRVRHKGSTYGFGPWSNGSSFTTKLAFYPANEEGKLVAGDRAANDYFGRSVTISGDGTRLAIGAYQADISSTTDAGAVYVFSRSGSSWTQEAKITASDKAINDHFYISRLDYSGTRLIVGAVDKTVSGNNAAGQVYVFTRSGTTWTQEAILFPTADAAKVLNFGGSIEVDSDANRVIIGCENATENSINYSGSVYIYSRSGVTWVQEAKLIASDIATNASFGRSVDITLDGTRCVVGSHRANVSDKIQAGAAYVFSRSGTSWTQEAKLTASTPAANDFFGYSVSIDNTGSRIAVGAYQKSTSMTTQGGMVFVFSRSGTFWNQESQLQAADNGTAYFGFRCFIDKSGTYLYVSSHVHAIGSTLNAGVVYVFVRNGTTWTQINYMQSSVPESNAYFSIDLDVTDDGNRFVIGARGNDQGISNVGAAYVYS